MSPWADMSCAIWCLFLYCAERRGAPPEWVSAQRLEELDRCRRSWQWPESTSTEKMLHEAGMLDRAVNSTGSGFLTGGPPAEVLQRFHRCDPLRLLLPA